MEIVDLICQEDIKDEDIENSEVEKNPLEQETDSDPMDGIILELIESR